LPSKTRDNYGCFPVFILQEFRRHYLYCDHIFETTTVNEKFSSMRKFYTWPVYLMLLALTTVLLFAGCAQKENEKEREMEEEEYDGPDQAILFELERTKDPATGKVPWDQFLQAKFSTETARSAARLSNRIEALNWIERGSNGDINGPFGNSRPNLDQTSGRIRAAMVDSLDPAHNTVWVGGVDGGLWKTTDITATPATWTLVNDYLSNLAVAAICQDPRPGFQNIMYFCTGESFGNADAVQGVGVFKSVDAGATWSFLSSTSSYTAGTRIKCDYQGNVYLGTRGNGLLRSTDGGSTWTNITPSGLSANICDIEISNTAGPGRLHLVVGISSPQAYRYTDIPSTVSSGAGWITPVTAFPSANYRAEIGVSGNVLYAMPNNSSGQVPTIYKSIDGGDNWTAAGSTPASFNMSTFTNTQGWYDLSVVINPANPNECIIGGVDCAKTVDGGTTWTRISAWAGTSGQYVHADQHNAQWWDGGTKLMFTCDGGVHFSSNGGTTIRDRNKGLRLKQFYSVAIHPTETNCFLAGAQDNGVHRLNHPGLDSSIEVTGGDGCYVAIDQNEGQYQFGSYVYNVYRRSTNNGATWSTPVNNQSTGRFVNPWDYDNNANIIYACNSAGNYLRWDDPQTGSTTSVVSVPEFGTGNVSAVHASPYTANRVFFGTGSGTIFKVDNANVTPTATAITPSGASGYVNCVVTGSSDQFLLACYSNYNVMNVWVSTNGGTSWTGIDGNLPNMPVRWALFHPDDNTKAYIATETGVWETDLINGSSTVWNANPSFPNVRTDMIKYRASDRTIAAGTHGRGIWSAIIPPPSGFSFGATTPATVACPAPATMNVTLPTISGGGFSNPITLSATAGVPAGTSISFGTNPVNPGSSSVVTLNNANTLTPGTYNVTIQGTATGAPTQTTTIAYTINPGTGPAITTQPVSQTVCEGQNVTFSVVSTGTYQWQVSTNGGGSWSPVAGQTSASYTITGVTSALNNNQYRCVVSTLCGSTTSTVAILTINSAAAITGQPTDLNLCAGNAASFCVTATGTGITYQWESSAAGCAGPWTNIAGATSSCYNIASVTAGMNNTAYRCKVTSSCGPTTITSGCALLTVITSVSVTTQPVSQTICNGSNTSFTVAGSGSGIIYQWQVNTGSGFANINNGGVYSGATAATLNLTGANTTYNGYQYRCLLSNSTCTSPGISTAATLTVNAQPAISSNPVSLTICAGSNASFSVGASGTGITYQWQVNTGTGFVNVVNSGLYTGANTSTLSLTGVPVSFNGYQYQCVVSGTCSPAATSTVAILTVHAPVIVNSSPANAEVCAGTNATFTVTGTSVPAINYQWQVSTDAGASWTNLAGANAPSYTANGVIIVMNNNRYRCLLSNNTCTTPVASAAAILTVRVVPVVGLTAAPLSTLLPGETTTLTAAPAASTGGTISTTWTLNNNTIPVTGNTVQVTVANLGSYQVGIRETWPSSLFCSSLSPVVTITANVSDRLFIFPSPNDGNFSVSYYNTGGASTQRRIRIVDSKGAAVFDKIFAVSGPYTIIPVNLMRASRGLYYVIVGDAAGKKLAEGKVHVR
jgi:hypothetical protein